jgi:hypothetical protein
MSNQKTRQLSGEPTPMSKASPPSGELADTAAAAVGAAAITAMSEFQKQEGPTLGGDITIRDLINEGRRQNQGVLESIRQGIDDMNAGRTVSLDKFKADARTKHGIKV